MMDNEQVCREILSIARQRRKSVLFTPVVQQICVKLGVLLADCLTENA